MGWYRKGERVEFSCLLGKKIVAWEGQAGDEEIKITTSDGAEYLLYHEQDCCETVSVEDIDGVPALLYGQPVLIAEETSHSASEGGKTPEGEPVEYESVTWTFYRIATELGGVVVRWWGSSNGYYSEAVGMVMTKPPNEEPKQLPRAETAGGGRPV
jgi:hypothetical protein